MLLNWLQHSTRHGHLFSGTSEQKHLLCFSSDQKCYQNEYINISGRTYHFKTHSHILLEESSICQRWLLEFFHWDDICFVQLPDQYQCPLCADQALHLLLRMRRPESRRRRTSGLSLTRAILLHNCTTKLNNVVITKKYASYRKIDSRSLCRSVSVTNCKTVYLSCKGTPH